MKAAVLEKFKEPLVVRNVPDPTPESTGAIVRVQASGICRSDWHAWVGDWDWLGTSVPLPHVLGHEFSGVIEQVGSDIRKLRTGDRVIVPFSQGDGTCQECRSGHSNICSNALMPGFSYWGGYGQFVHIPNADLNLIPLPEGVGYTEAAALGCRFMTAFHGLVDRVAVQPGEWVAVHGCGGVGLSAIQIATALGANVIAIDISDEKLAFAERLGAVATINATKQRAADGVKEWTKGGADVSVDALGLSETCQSSVRSLRRRGRHLQIGLTTKQDDGVISLPIDLIVNLELQISGTFGMPIGRYRPLLQMVERGTLRPGELVTQTVTIDQAGSILSSMSHYATLGCTVIDQW
ncbi:MAG: zinc-dependent alcohol dehydrogenase family protein [Alicyclobacillaceae bacterium]|nr:zinc-dependent alcohol dehydrogenase family protein [Alicyclobacillaceae bacterium]